MANTLKFGNGTWATKKDSILAYSDTNENYKPLPFSYTGAGKGTRVNKEGLIEVVENDRPRIDYTDSEDGVLLLEPASTNVFLYSNKFDTAWQGNYTVLTSGQIGVGGSTDAWLLSGFAGTSEKRIRQYPPSSGSYAVSVYAKAGTVDYLWLRGVTTSANRRTFFNLSTGQVGLDGAVSSNMVDMGNGWYRCEAVFNQQSGFEFYIGLSDKENAITSTTGNIYIQNAQAEIGNVASSYIPTQGSAQTRVQETASGSGNSEVFNSQEGILMVETKSDNDGTFNYISLSDGGTTNYAGILYTDNNNELAYRYYVGGSGVQIIANGINVTNFNKIAIKWKVNDFAFWINGFEVGTASSGSLNPSGTFNELSFARGGSNNTPFYGSTKEISYYDKILTDEELEYMTSYRTWESMVNELNLNVIYNG